MGLSFPRFFQQQVQFLPGAWVVGAKFQGCSIIFDSLRNSLLSGSHQTQVIVGLSKLGLNLNGLG